VPAAACIGPGGRSPSEHDCFCGWPSDSASSLSLQNRPNTQQSSLQGSRHMLHLGQIRPGLDRGETCRYVVRFGQAAAEWGQAGIDGTTAVARRNSVRDPSVPLPACGGGRPPCGVCRCWMDDVAAGFGLKTACLLLVAQFRSGTHGRQTAQTHCLRKSHQQMQRTHGGGAGARVQQEHCIIRCYIHAIHSCLRPHYATQKPSQKPCPLRVLQDARTSVRTPHMRCCWLCRVRCAATNWAAPAAGGAVGEALSAASSAEGEAAAERQASARCHHVVKVAVSRHLPECNHKTMRAA